jgi:type II secretory pathway pseudopilin PulG
MGHERPRWRLRLSTLMLLVVIAALASYIVVERWQRVQDASRRRLAAEQRRAALIQQLQAELRRAQVQTRGASPPAQAGTSPAAEK